MSTAVAEKKPRLTTSAMIASEVSGLRRHRTSITIHSASEMFGDLATADSSDYRRNLLQL